MAGHGQGEAEGETMNKITGNVPVAAGRGKGKMMLTVGPSGPEWMFYKRRRLFGGVKHERKRNGKPTA